MKTYQNSTALKPTGRGLVLELTGPIPSLNDVIRAPVKYRLALARASKGYVSATIAWSDACGTGRTSTPSTSPMDWWRAEYARTTALLKCRKRPGSRRLSSGPEKRNGS